MKKYLFVFFAAATFSSCAKNDAVNVVVPSSGTILFKNSSLYPYNVYINNTFKVELSAAHAATYTAAYGAYECKAGPGTGAPGTAAAYTVTDSVTATHNITVTIN